MDPPTGPAFRDTSAFLNAYSDAHADSREGELVIFVPAHVKGFIQTSFCIDLSHYWMRIGDASASIEIEYVLKNPAVGPIFVSSDLLRDSICNFLFCSVFFG